MDGNLQKYQAFAKVVEYGTITRAAEILSYSQPSISKMISDLEHEWNMTLLDRNKKGVSLTTEGQEMLPYVKQLVEDFQRMENHASALCGIQTGRIRIGTFSSAATHWVPNLVRAFQTDYPGIDYEILIGDYSEIEDWIAEGRVDCGFLRLPTHSEFYTIFLERHELLVVMPEDHPLTKKAAIDLSDLNGERFLVREQRERNYAEVILEKSNIRPDIRYAPWDDNTLIAMVEAGLGIGILPELDLKRTPYRVVTRSLSQPHYNEIAFVLRNYDLASAATKMFIQYLSRR